MVCKINKKKKKKPKPILHVTNLTNRLPELIHAAHIVNIYYNGQL